MDANAGRAAVYPASAISAAGTRKNGDATCEGIDEPGYTEYITA